MQSASGNTPTPGDLSARTRLLNCAVDAINDYAALVGDDHDVGTCNCDLVDIANGLTALSALPAAGGAWQPITSVPRDGTRVVVWMPDGTFSSASYSAHSEPQGVYWMIPTTPQPSATEGGEERARRLYEPDEYEDAFKGREDAAVGVQGDGYPNTSDVPDSELREQLSACRDDWQRLCDAVEPGQHFDPDDLIRRLAAPAAGKGVDEPAGWNIRRRNGGLLITGPGGMSAHVDESLEQGIAGAVLHALAKDLLSSTAALTRQPVAGENDNG